MSLIRANASGAISFISCTFHRVENLDIKNTDPSTRTPEMVNDDGPNASITALFSLSGPKASLERSIPSASNGDEGFGVEARDALGAAGTPFWFGEGRVDKLRRNAREMI